MTFSDADLDDMHHALGRPDSPLVTPYRNRYVLDADSDDARRMAASEGWRLVGHINGGRDAVFAVTLEGTVAMFRWLKAKHEVAGLRRYRVSISAGEIYDHEVLAKSPAAAKHDLFLHLSDAGWCPDGYQDFIRYQPRARLA